MYWKYEQGYCRVEEHIIQTGITYYLPSQFSLMAHRDQELSVSDCGHFATITCWYPPVQWHLKLHHSVLYWSVACHFNAHFVHLSRRAPTPGDVIPTTYKSLSQPRSRPTVVTISVSAGQLGVSYILVCWTLVAVKAAHVIVESSYTSSLSRHTTLLCCLFGRFSHQPRRLEHILA